MTMNEPTKNTTEKKDGWRPSRLILGVVGIIIILLTMTFCPTAQTTENNGGATTRPPMVYTQDVVMVTESTNLSAPFGYHLEVNWGYAPIHVVTNATTEVTERSLGHTEYGIGEGLTFEFNPNYEPQPTTLHCTYTEIK